MSWDDYQPYKTIVKFVSQLQKSHPKTVFVEDLGKTLEGRRLFVVSFCSSGVCGKKPGMWLDALTHAREWTTGTSITFIMNELINKRKKYSKYVEALDWYFMPIVNPDGYVFSMEHDSNWRTNRVIGSSCTGVDINRNYPIRWSQSKCGESYSGPKPFSEVESKLQADFIVKKKNVIKFYNSFHNYGELLLFPWSSTKLQFAQEASHLKLGNRGVKSIAFKSGHKYKVGSVSKILYMAKGSSLDYYTTIGIPYVYAMEIGTSFIAARTDIIPLGKEVLQFHLNIAEQIIEEFVKN